MTPRLESTHLALRAGWADRGQKLDVLCSRAAKAPAALTLFQVYPSNNGPCFRLKGCPPRIRYFFLTSPTALAEPSSSAAARKSFALVFICTLIGAVAQILVKKGTEQLGTAHVTLGQVARDPSLFLIFAFGIVTNLRLLMGYSLLGVNTFLLALALKGRELSRLYPIIALTYVWVTILSLFVLPGEHLNWLRAAGIATIVTGVSILGLKK
jgi:multidrug transporter EmrE-like cation transporter